MKEFEEKIIEYKNFKSNLVNASTQMLKIMSDMEIEMISKEILAFLKKKYKIENLPEIKVINNILMNVFKNSVIRSESEVYILLSKVDNEYTDKNENEIYTIIDEEIKILKKDIRNIYNVKTTSCYADFPRRCTEDIFKELKKLNNSENFDANIIKMKMQTKKELTKVLQKFLDGAYKMLNVQIINKMENILKK